jgi:hypothetical protein
VLIETLLWECFAGPSRLVDAALSAVVQYEKLASTMALRMDSPAFRAAMQVEADPLCDGLFWGLSREEEKEPKVHLLFVEFKGKAMPHAVEQLAQSIGIVRSHLQGVISEPALTRTRFSAVVVSDRAGPGHDVSSKDIRRFKRDFNSTLYVRSAQRRGAAIDLSRELWRRAIDPSGPI